MSMRGDPRKEGAWRTIGVGSQPPEADRLAVADRLASPLIVGIRAQTHSAQNKCSCWNRCKTYRPLTLGAECILAPIRLFRSAAHHIQYLHSLSAGPTPTCNMCFCADIRTIFNHTFPHTHFTHPSHMREAVSWAVVVVVVDIRPGTIGALCSESCVQYLFAAELIAL